MVKEDTMEEGSSTITEAEAALYDRQIRLWGLNSQKKLREASVLLVGLNGLGAEVAKNLALIGVKSITMIDDTKVSEADSSSQFFIIGSDQSKTRAEASRAGLQELNPNVKIEVESGPVLSKGPDYLKDFTVVFATGLDASSLTRLNKLCRAHKVPFFCGDTWGLYGYGFVDLLNHKYLAEESQDLEMTTRRYDYFPLDVVLKAKVGSGLNKKVNKVFILLHIMNNFYEQHQKYPQPATRDEDIEVLSKMNNLTHAHLGVFTNKITREMLSNLFGELSPVCASVGGIMANEIIKGITGKGVPVYNFFLFDGETCTGFMETITNK